MASAANFSRTDLLLRSLADVGWTVTVCRGSVGVLSVADNGATRVLTCARSREAVVVLLAQYVYGSPQGDPSNS